MLLDALLDAAAGLGRGRGRDGHGPPRPPQRAGQHRGQVLPGDLRGVRGQPRPRVGAGLGRREVPQGRPRGVPRQRRGGAPHHPGLQPLAPRGGGPRRRGHDPGQAGPDLTADRRDTRGRGRRRRRVPVHVRPRPRRRRLRRPGRGGRDAQPLRSLGLPHRRHGARRHQQPARLHHGAGLGPHVGVPDRRGQDGAGADLPRERRRPRGRASAPPAWPSRSARPSTRTWSSTSSATASTGTTRATTRATPSRSCTSGSTPSARCASSTPRRWCAGATSRSRRPSPRSTTSTPACRSSSTRCGASPRWPRPSCPRPTRARRTRPPPRPASSPDVLHALSSVVRSVPDGFMIHPKLERQFVQRDELVAGGQVDWALAEALAIGSLMYEGVNVRLTGPGHPARHLQPPPRRAGRLLQRRGVRPPRPHPRRPASHRG